MPEEAEGVLQDSWKHLTERDRVPQILRNCSKASQFGDVASVSLQTFAASPRADHFQSP
jgi:hypothetical protein